MNATSIQGSWDESLHPRGKTSDESTPGSFAPVGLGTTTTVRGYHGGPTLIKSFDKNKVGSQTGEGWLGEGFYFSPYEDAAKSYGSKITTADITLKNPYRFPEDVNPIKFVKQHGGPKEFTKWVKSQGHDGIISDSVLHQIVVFEPEAISIKAEGITATMSNKLRLETIRFEIQAAARGPKDVYPFVATITYGDRLSDGDVGGTEAMPGGPYRVNIPAALLEAKIAELGQHYSDMVAHNSEPVSVKVQGRGVFAAKDLKSHNKSIRVGEFVSAWVQRESDGSLAAKASGFLYRESDPALVDEIIALSRDGLMGFSYDLVQVASDVKELNGEKFLEITGFEWRGATILRRAAAAYEDTALAANSIEKEKDMEMDEKKLLETITSCLTPFKTDVINEIGKLKTDFAELKASQIKLEANLAAAKSAENKEEKASETGNAELIAVFKEGFKELNDSLKASKPDSGEGVRRSKGPLEMYATKYKVGDSEAEFTAETFTTLKNLIDEDSGMSKDEKLNLLAAVSSGKRRFLKGQMAGGAR